jgi:hypothetical protein
LGVDGAVGILYNTVIVNGDQERVWVGASVIRELAKKFLLYPGKPSMESAAASGRFEYGSKY